MKKMSVDAKKIDHRNNEEAMIHKVMYESNTYLYCYLFVNLQESR